MEYVPDWERLSDALDRVMSAGRSRKKAQVNLCRATADQKIKVRYLISKEIVGGCEMPKGSGIAGHVVSRLDIIPRSLNPADFNWEQSQPTRPWQLLPNPVFWQLDWIELYSSDVTRVLIRSQDSATDLSQAETSQPARSLAKKALSAIFPEGIPDRTVITDQQLCAKVQDWLKATHRKVGCDTIWRAAGRRK